MLLSTGLAHGHGTGQSVEKTVGDYTVDIGYDSLSPEIPTGDPVRFDFNLWNNDKTEPIDFTTVWVNIAPQNGQGFLFAGTLGVPDFGPTGMSYVFSKSGSYALTIHFNNKDKALADVSFPLIVQGGVEGSSQTQSLRNLAISGFIGFMVGIILTFFFRKRS